MLIGMTWSWGRFKLYLNHKTDSNGWSRKGFVKINQKAMKSKAKEKDGADKPIYGVAMEI